jgi:pimeloyl-ACP methyl ester carboxylesterase
VVRSGFVEVLGLRMRVREAGEGEPVLLLHGLGVSGRYFMPLASVLAARRHVIVPDLPGWGRSERPSRALGVGGAADVLGELVRRRCRGAVSIVANSFGCQVALMLAQRCPELVGPLILVGPTVDPRYRSWSVHVVRLAVDSLREPPALWRILFADYARMGFRRVAATAQAALEDRPEDLVATVRRPILVVRGERDAICTLEWAAECASRARRGSFAPVAGAAHAAHFSHPLVVARLVESFLEEGPDRLGKLDG